MKSFVPCFKPGRRARTPSIALSLTLLALMAIQPAGAIGFNITGTYDFNNQGMPTLLPLGPNHQLLPVEVTFSGSVNGSVDIPGISDFNSLSPGSVLTGAIILDLDGTAQFPNRSQSGGIFAPGLDGGSGTFTRSFLGPNFFDAYGVSRGFDPSQDNGAFLSSGVSRISGMTTFSECTTRTRCFPASNRRTR